MITKDNREEMFAHMTPRQLEKVKSLEQEGWSILDYCEPLGRIIMASPTETGASYTRTIYRDGHG